MRNSSMNLAITFTREQDVLLFRLGGNLLEVKDAEPVFFELDNHPDPIRMVINCSQIKLLNSSGINVFLKILTKLRNRGGELVLCELPQHIAKLLIITKLNSIFSVFENEEQAINFFKQSKS